MEKQAIRLWSRAVRTATVSKANFAIARSMWAASLPMPSGCTTCTATSRNGVRTVGTHMRTTYPRTDLPGWTKKRTSTSYGEVLGSAARGLVVPAAAPPICLPLASTTSVFALLFALRKLHSLSAKYCDTFPCNVVARCCFPLHARIERSSDLPCRRTGVADVRADLPLRTQDAPKA